MDLFILGSAVPATASAVGPIPPLEIRTTNFTAYIKIPLILKPLISRDHYTVFRLFLLFLHSTLHVELLVTALKVLPDWIHLAKARKQAALPRLPDSSCQTLAQGQV